VPEEPVHAALDERVARTGQRHVAEPAVGTRPLPAHQALAFGPGHALRDGPGADQAQLGDGARGEPVRRARPAQGGQQVQGGGVDAEPGQGAAALVCEQLSDPPDPGDDADGPGRGSGPLALPGALDPVDVVLVLTGMVVCAAGRGRRRVGHINTLDLKELPMRQIVVTGGGTGIGYAIAGEFVRSGDQVTITGRRETC